MYDRFLQLDTIYEADADVRRTLEDIAVNVLPTAKDEWDAENGASGYIEAAVESFEMNLRTALGYLIKDWQEMDCQECDGSGDCPDCEWMRRDNPESFAEEIENCGSCGGAGVCGTCDGSGSAHN